MIAHATLSSGVHGSGCRPRTTNSAGRFCSAALQQRVDPGGVGDDRGTDLRARLRPLRRGRAPHAERAQEAIGLERRLLRMPRQGGRSRSAGASRAATGDPAHGRSRDRTSRPRRDAAWIVGMPCASRSIRTSAPQPGDGQRAVGLRQRRARIPPEGRRRDRQQQKDGQHGPSEPFHRRPPLVAPRSGAWRLRGVRFVPGRRAGAAQARAAVAEVNNWKRLPTLQHSALPPDADVRLLEKPVERADGQPVRRRRLRVAGAFDRMASVGRRVAWHRRLGTWLASGFGERCDSTLQSLKPSTRRQTALLDARDRVSRRRSTIFRARPARAPRSSTSAARTRCKRCGSSATNSSA